MKRTPLKRSTPLKRPTKPIPRIGARSIRWDGWRTQQKKLVRKRSNNICEVEGCSTQGCEWHHVFMRGHIVPEPWASHKLLTMDLCTEHHRLAHSSPIFLNELRWRAIELFIDETIEAVIVHSVEWYRENDWTAVQTIKDILIGNNLIEY